MKRAALASLSHDDGEGQRKKVVTVSGRRDS